MNITNITDDYNKTLVSNSSNNEDSKSGNIEIVIPLFTIIPCGFSFICLISLMVYTLIKTLIRKK